MTYDLPGCMWLSGAIIYLIVFYDHVYLLNETLCVNYTCSSYSNFIRRAKRLRSCMYLSLPGRWTL